MYVRALGRQCLRGRRVDVVQCQYDRRGSAGDGRHRGGSRQVDSGGAQLAEVLDTRLDVAVRAADGKGCRPDHPEAGAKVDRVVGQRHLALVSLILQCRQRGRAAGHPPGVAADRDVPAIFAVPATGRVLELDRDGGPAGDPVRREDGLGRAKIAQHVDDIHHVRGTVLVELGLDRIERITLAAARVDVDDPDAVPGPEPVDQLVVADQIPRHTDEVELPLLPCRGDERIQAAPIGSGAGRGPLRPRDRVLVGRLVVRAAAQQQAGHHGQARHGEQSQPHIDESRSVTLRDRM